ncbi:DUF1822 family protein [Iningainema tapete]|uniref:DUF1822 family protein n=1 Tax=Iningainema tapete BLCC-T55 TaxID=2748662 RepID=A0A8J6XUP2_9CYAN|nr:DUF1822 family protein [Iningainema tapete]MBD2778924.1 DUF1822 family protein [Iningainema tapete BLCC-T55]
MQSVSESLTFTVPLGLEARTLAEKFRRKHSNPDKGQQVYLNTLAVAAVKFYLRCIGWETDWEASLSYNPLMQGLMDVADLQVRGLGKLECRPVLPSSQTVFVPPEVSTDRIGYVAVQLDESFKTATILGFVKTPTNSGEIFLSELESLADLLSHLHQINQREVVKTRVKLSQWFDNLFESSWMALEEIFGGMEQKFALRNVSLKREVSVARAKIIDLGLQLGNQSVVLLVAIAQGAAEPSAPYSEQKVEILVQLHPIDGQTYLPSNLKLNLLSESGEIMQEVKSRSNDNFIQLKRFRGYSGECFNIQVSYGDFTIKETFVI